jgi:ppGpp synthetase/RelA/SpoT-type nucleotidyltranferase
MNERTPESWSHSLRLLHPLFSEFGRELQTLLERLLRTEGISFDPMALRVKSPGSFLGKLKRKGDRYPNPLHQMPDLVGLRVVVHDLGEIDRVETAVRREFAVDETQTRRLNDLAAPSSFGYRALHLVVRLDSRRSHLPEWEQFSGLLAEIQVQTLLQHTWHVVDHRVRYKRPSEVTPHEERALSLISAVLESVDNDIARVIRESLPETDAELPGQLAPMLDPLSVERFLTEAGLHKRWYQVAIQTGFVPDTTAMESEELGHGSLLYLRFLASYVGIESVHEFRQILDGIDEDTGRSILAAVADIASSGTSEPPRTTPHDAVSMLLHVRSRVSPWTLIDVAQAMSTQEVGFFVQGWFDLHTTNALEALTSHDPSGWR